MPVRYRFGTEDDTVFDLNQMDCARPTEKRKFISNIYYIRDWAVTAGDGIPTLVRSSFNLDGGVPAHQDAVAMIEGIEGFRVELGIDDRSNAYAGEPTGTPVNYAEEVDWLDPDTRTTPTNRGDGSPDGAFITCTIADAVHRGPVDERHGRKNLRARAQPRTRAGLHRHQDVPGGRHGDGTVQRWLQAPRVRLDAAPAEHRWTETDSMRTNSPQSQRGAALVVGLIMLVLVTVMLISALVMSTSGFRSVSNMQFREEAIAAANRAIDQVISSPFMLTPTAETISVDIDNDGDEDYSVDIDEPVCISATQAFGADPSSLQVSPALTVASTWNTVWDIRATVNADENAGGAAIVVRAGVRALLSEADKDAVCT